MKVKITRSTIADGKSVFEGDTVDLTDATARQLIQMGKAEGTGKDAPDEDDGPSSETAHIVPKDHAAGPAEDASADPKKVRKEVSRPKSRENR